MILLVVVLLLVLSLAAPPPREPGSAAAAPALKLSLPTYRTCAAILHERRGLPFAAWPSLASCWDGLAEQAERW